MKRIILFIILLFPIYSFENSTNQSIIQKIESGIEIFSIDNGKLIDKGYNLEDGNFIEIEYYQIGINNNFYNNNFYIIYYLPNYRNDSIVKEKEMSNSFGYLHFT